MNARPALASALPGSSLSLTPSGRQYAASVDLPGGPVAVPGRTSERLVERPVRRPAPAQLSAPEAPLTPPTAGWPGGAPRVPPGDLPSGTVVADRYLIEGRLGHGGFAAVYRARQANLGRGVALKVLRPHPAVPLDGQRARLQREAEALSRLSAPECVRIYDVGELPDGRPWLAQELVQGTRLDLALKDGPFPPARAVEVAAGVLSALADAHAHGVVHRDIKPDNIMLVAGADGRERVKVLDFGIARLQGPEDADRFHTSTRHVFGTPQYMSPEQARQEAIGPAADLYAVGILLHRLLTGREPFDGPDGHEILRSQVYDAVPRPAGVPSALAEVMMRALAKRPEDRHASATAMRAALRAAVATPDASPPRRGLLLVVAVAVGLAGGFTLGVLAARAERARALEAAPTPVVYPAEVRPD